MCGCVCICVCVYVRVLLFVQCIDILMLCVCAFVYVYVLPLMPRPIFPMPAAVALLASSDDTVHETIPAGMAAVRAICHKHGVWTCIRRFHTLTHVIPCHIHHQPIVIGTMAWCACV